MSYSLLNYLDKYTIQVFILLIGMLFIILGVLFYVWLSNRRKFHQYKHQIPSSVLKNYLDSIIQNSTALKSSLFRGGGLDIDASGAPSVLPLDQLKSGAAFDVVDSSGDESLRAEISRLQNVVSEKNKIIKELEDAIRGLEGDNKAKADKIIELEKLLDSLKNQTLGDGDNTTLIAENDALKLRNSELEEQLKEYEIIGDDLANLKRVKQENAQLKQALEDLGHSTEAADMGSTPIVEEESVAEHSEPKVKEEVKEEVEHSEPEVKEEVKATEETVEGDEVEAKEGEEEEEKKEPVNTKSPEDLLSEFEKMLG